MKKTLAKGIACLAFAFATTGAAANSLPADVFSFPKGPYHPLNPLNPRPLTSNEWAWTGGILGAVLAGGVAACVRPGRKKPKV